MDEAARVARALQRWGEHPERFVREALGAVPEPWQEEVLAQIARGRRRIAIRSGHGVGKTALQAWLMLWFGTTRADAKIPATAPTSHQLVDLLWGEAAKWRLALAERLPTLGEAIEIRADRIDFLPWRSTAYARTSRRDQSEALQGFHAANLMFLIDEGSGVDDRVFETYWTTDRGTEIADWSYGLLDLTTYGRQEGWQDSPPGWPVAAPAAAWRVDGRPTVQWRVTDEPAAGSGGCH